FSSRRRHTRFSRDWSSDVCSSDLAVEQREPAREPRVGEIGIELVEIDPPAQTLVDHGGGGQRGEEQVHPRIDGLELGAGELLGEIGRASGRVCLWRGAVAVWENAG